MAEYNIIEWQNENRLNSFPFESDIVVPDFIVDAKFVQFNNFVPILNYISVDSNSIRINITHDDGVIEVLYIKASNAKSIRIYTADSYRYLGVLTIGPGAEALLQSYIGQTLTYNTKFVPETVISIPSSAGVFTFDRNFGEVSLARGSEDTTIFYNINSELNSITLNAVGGHEAVGPARGLRQINLVKPKDNNINLMSNDVIKFKSLDNATGLEIKLASGSPDKAFNLPTLY